MKSATALGLTPLNREKLYLFLPSTLSPEFTARLVDRWRELESMFADRGTPAIPRTYKEALVHLLHQVEENERLEKENEALGVALSNAKPKAILMDTICGTADELYGLNEAGRILGTSGAVRGALRDSLGDVYVKRKYTTVNRQFLKIFIDRGYGKTLSSETDATRPSSPLKDFALLP